MPLGMHFAISPDQASTLAHLTDDDVRRDFIDDIENDAEPDWQIETDKAWVAIHRTLTGYPAALEYFTADEIDRHGPEGLRLCIMGGTSCYEGSDYIVRLVPADKVSLVAEALAAIDEEWFGKNYRERCDGAWPEFGEDDLEYSWTYFEPLKDFFARAAAAGRAVIFTADQ